MTPARRQDLRRGRLYLLATMKTVVNRTGRALRIPLTRGRVLRLGPRKEGQKAPLAEFNVAEQFSDLAGYEVYVTNLERVDDRYREAELRKAERFYGRLQ